MMERVKHEKSMAWLHAAGRYIKREAQSAICPECGQPLRLAYTPDVHDAVVSLSIVCEACQKYAVVSSARKPDWMN